MVDNITYQLIQKLLLIVGVYSYNYQHRNFTIVEKFNGLHPIIELHPTLWLGDSPLSLAEHGYRIGIKYRDLEKHKNKKEDMR